MLEKVQSVCHIASLSDHCGIKMRLQVNITRTVLPKKERRTYWKLNCAILNDEDFLPSFKLLWEKIVKFRQNYQDIADWWDICAKPSIKNFCMAVSSHLAHIRRDTKRYLFSYLNVVLQEGNWSEAWKCSPETFPMCPLCPPCPHP